MRSAKIDRKTNETTISVTINLDGTGEPLNSTGIGFFDHMLDQLAKHSLIDIEINADGDLHIDDHHTVEDIGICLGKAFKKALGNKVGVKRYGSSLLPMDETLVRSAIDLSGRAFFFSDINFNSAKIGFFDTKSGTYLNEAMTDGKNDGLLDFLKSDSNYFGGIVTNTKDDGSGVWKVFKKPSHKFIRGDFKNWENLNF